MPPRNFLLSIIKITFVKAVCNEKAIVGLDDHDRIGVRSEDLSQHKMADGDVCQARNGADKLAGGL